MDTYIDRYKGKIDTKLLEELKLYLSNIKEKLQFLKNFEGFDKTKKEEEKHTYIIIHEFNNLNKLNQNHILGLLDIPTVISPPPHIITETPPHIITKTETSPSPLLPSPSPSPSPPPPPPPPPPPIITETETPPPENIRHNKVISPEITRIKINYDHLAKLVVLGHHMLKI